MYPKICSYNVRGLGNKNKREQVFAWLKEKNFSICLLQETHSGEGTHDFWKQEWGNEAFFSGKTNSSEGTGILINSNFNCTIQNYNEIIKGRIQALELIIEGKEITILNIYGPNTDDVAFFETLDNYLSENEEKSFIVGGDFNTVLDIHLDKKNGKLDTHKACRSKINGLMEKLALVDIWRHKHPDLKQYTWHSSQKPPIFCRLDYFLLSDNLLNITVRSEHISSYKSDHSIVSLELDFVNIERGPGYFKLNNSLILDPEYQQIIRASIIDIAALNNKANPNTLWELIKGTIRNETIRYATMKKKEQNKHEQNILTDIKNIEEKLSITDNLQIAETLKLNLDEKKKSLDTLNEQKLKGIILRSKAQIVEQNEKNSKYFASLEKKRSEAKLITRLNINGSIITDAADILKEGKNFYEKLYSKKDRKTSLYNFFDNSINKLNESDKLKCEGLITIDECTKSLLEMKNQKSPGSDGITTEFYKIFWNDIKQFYVNSINYSYENGQLTELQKQSIITLIPKPGKDTTDLKNWRPISLLNVDYKIATKVIANRIKNVLTSIISSSQTGFMKGRYIGENIRILFELLDYTDEHAIPGMIFFSDFEKAFDSVDHHYLLECLKHFNFSESCINWIKLFYNDAHSCISNNGNLSDFFPIQRGVRQGCPLSPYLFILCIELLSYQVTNNKDIKGIHLAGNELKDLLFADDASFILDGSKKSFETLIDIMDNFSNISGLKLNAKKCQILRIGSLKTTNTIHLKHRKFHWTSTEANSLGMVFKTNKDNIFAANLEPKIKEFETCLKQWQHRKLTLMGKIVVVKNLALPKLIYPLTTLPNPSEDTIKRIEKLMFNFIWDGKPEKIKRNTLKQTYENGGLRMIDLEKFIWSLKVSWIKRIIDPKHDTLFKHIYINKLKDFCGKLYFECNFSEEDILKAFKQDGFFRDVLIAWCKLNKKEVTLNYCNEIIWNNSHIRAGGCTLLFKKWYQLGIKFLKDIYDYERKFFYPFQTLKELYKLPENDFLKYLTLISSIPSDWKANLKFENMNVPRTPTIFDQLLTVKHTNKFIYNMFLNKINIEGKKSETKWNNFFLNEDLNWKVIYVTPIKSLVDIKIRNFQYKFLHKILPTNQFLAKCNIVSSALCDFCNMEIETVNHLFWECIHVQSFWMQLSSLLQEKNVNIELNFKKIAFGECQLIAKYDTQVKNFIIFVAKYFIFANKYSKMLPTLQGFKPYIYQKIQIEKEIAFKKDKIAHFENKWRNVLNIFT